MLTKGDDYPLHQTAEPVAYSGTDRNFYDRYFFNGYSSDGRVFFAAALGVYPHLNIMDAAFCVVVDGMQHNLHASRHLQMERLDTRVGPISVSVVEPLQTLRVAVDDPERGIRADIVFEGCAPVIEEPRFTRRVGPRSFMDYTRMTQPGTYTGWIEIDGKRVDVGGTKGTRDRSWGVRPIGIPDPQPMEPALLAQFHWLWCCLHFDDAHALYMINADEHGKPWNWSALVGRLGKDAHPEHMRSAVSALDIPTGSRHARGARLSFVHGDGSESHLELKVHWNFYMSGLGYFNPDWAHGLNKGPLAVGYDAFRTADIKTFAPPYTHVQAFVTARMEHAGRIKEGSGILEQLLLGPYAPLGLQGLLDPAS